MGATCALVCVVALVAALTLAKAFLLRTHIYRTHSSSGIIQKRGSRQQAATPTPLNIHVPSHSNHEDLLPGWSV